MANFLEPQAIKIEQPFGFFYACKIQAKDLLELAFADPIRYEDGEYKGNQRELDERKRVNEIQSYVEGYDAAFPNSIILSANYDENGFNVAEEELRWRFDSDTGKLIIPTETKLASVIDGQHRLFGFRGANPKAKEMELLCSVYIDLPNSWQAFLFATINTNQKPVDKSLSYIQFGFNAEDEDAISWAPDKVAIAFHNKFNDEIKSPFYNHIKLAPQIDAVLRERLGNSKWLVSTATIVDGILRLISTNPKRDKYELQKYPKKERLRSKLNLDTSPLRILYLEAQDVVIYQIIFNFFKAAEAVLLDKASSKSSIVRTVGIQGLFDVLKRVLDRDREQDSTFRTIDLTINRFVVILSAVANVEFESSFYQFSGVGRKNIADTILFANDYIDYPAIPSSIDEKKREAFEKKRAHLDEIDRHLKGII